MVPGMRLSARPMVWTRRRCKPPRLLSGAFAQSRHVANCTGLYVLHNSFFRLTVSTVVAASRSRSREDGQDFAGTANEGLRRTAVVSDELKDLYDELRRRGKKEKSKGGRLHEPYMGLSKFPFTQSPEAR